MEEDDMDKFVGMIQRVLETPNEFDSNGECANVVDGLYAISRGLHAVAEAIKNKE